MWLTGRSLGSEHPSIFYIAHPALSPIYPLNLSLVLSSSFVSFPLIRLLADSQRWPFCFCRPYLMFAVYLSVITLLLAFHPGAKTQDSHWPRSHSYAPKRLLCKITHSPPTPPLSLSIYLSVSLKHTHMYSMFKINLVIYTYISMCTHLHILSTRGKSSSHTSVFSTLLKRHKAVTKNGVNLTNPRMFHFTKEQRLQEVQEHLSLSISVPLISHDGKRQRRRGTGRLLLLWYPIIYNVVI